jgi:hypothetical protein
LLNLEHQVRLNDLPWIQAIESFRKDDLNTQEQARLTLEQVLVMAITAFPQQILPNKLLQEIRALAESAGLRLPIVDEVAADIFMGAFSEKYLRAAQQAGSLLEGTLYERYYGISYARVRQLNDVKPSPYGAATSPGFFNLCCEMAGVSLSEGRWSVTRNGRIIEQEQILTTHNLAVLFDGLGLAASLRPRLGELASHCFEWICRRHQQKRSTWKAVLQMVKNTAYAWRQMIFFLSLMPADDVEAFLGWAYEHLEKQQSDYQMRFKPAVDGLALAFRGRSFHDRTQLEREGIRRFLGWTTEKHWLLS